MKKHLLQILSTGVLTLLLAFAFGACGSTSTSNNSSAVTVHLGYFPNITHAVALVGVGPGRAQIIWTEEGQRTLLGPRAAAATAGSPG